MPSRNSRLAPPPVEMCPNPASSKPSVRTAAAEIEAGKKTPRETKPKTEIAMPQDFAAALRETPAANATFGGFTDAQRRDYLEWIVSAKQEATRSKRIATAIEWLTEGKRRNWKYEKC